MSPIIYFPYVLSQVPTSSAKKGKKRAREDEEEDSGEEQEGSNVRFSKVKQNFSLFLEVRLAHNHIERQG
jgi:hypothetical protein